MNKKKIDQIKTFSSHFYDIISISQVSDLQILSGKRPNTRAAQGLMCCPHHRKDISYASYSPQTFIVIYCMPELWATRVFGYYQSYQFYRKKTLNCTGSMCCPHHRKDISYASYSPRTFIVIYCMPELWAARVFGYYQSDQF